MIKSGIVAFLEGEKECKTGEMPLNEFSQFLIYICQFLHAEYKAIFSINAWKIVFL